VKAREVGEMMAIAETAGCCCSEGELGFPALGQGSGGREVGGGKGEGREGGGGGFLFG
jgi:hypothetical protein